MLRRFLIGLPIWTLVVAGSAAPSFMFSPGASVEGRLAGIAIWIVIYALISSTDFFARGWSRRPERTAIMLTYGLRAVLGALMTIFVPLALVDIFAGLISLRVAETLTGQHMLVDSGSGPAAPFIPTMIATFTQGLLLSILTLVVLTVIRAICLAMMRSPARDGPRGFEVVMPPKPDDPAPPR